MYDKFCKAWDEEDVVTQQIEYWHLPGKCTFRVSAQVPFLAVRVISSQSRVSAPVSCDCSNCNQSGKSSEIPRDFNDRSDEVDDSEVSGNMDNFHSFSDTEE